MASVVISSTAKVAKQGPSKLSQVLGQLNKQPRLQLLNVTNFKVQWCARNQSFGARYFVKDALPRIRWANPSLPIEVDKVWKKEGPVKQRIELTFASGKIRTIEMDNKWSTAIIRELMEVAGGDPWRDYKKSHSASGLPLIPGEEEEFKRHKLSSRNRKAAINPETYPN